MHLQIYTHKQNEREHKNETIDKRLIETSGAGIKTKKKSNDSRKIDINTL